MCRLGSTAPTAEQRQEPLLRSCRVVLRLQPFQNWPSDQSLLCLSDIILGLRLDQRLLDSQRGLAAFDLVGHVRHQPIGYVLEHHRLQRERGRTNGLGVLDQRASPQRLDRVPYDGTT